MLGLKQTSEILTICNYKHDENVLILAFVTWVLVGTEHVYNILRNFAGFLFKHVIKQSIGCVDLYKPANWD